MFVILCIKITKHPHYSQDYICWNAKNCEHDNSAHFYFLVNAHPLLLMRTLFRQGDMKIEFIQNRIAALFYQI